MSTTSPEVKSNPSLDKMKEMQKDLASPQKSSKEYAVSKDIKGNGVNNIFRIIDSENFAKCSRSWIVCDDGMIRPFTLIDNYGNRSPLLKLLGNPDEFYRGGILESVKDEITKKGVYKYKDTYPELIKRLGYNGDMVASKGNAKLQKQVVYQIIDRDLFEGVDESGNKIQYYWCKENKHAMLLWLKTTAFDTLISTVEGNGDPTEYDCAYTKVGSSISTTHVIQKAGPMLPGVVVGDLTEEELDYARYNLDDEVSLSPAGYIIHFLGKLIKDIDILLGFNVFDELQEITALDRSEQSDSGEVNGSTEYETEEEEDSAVPASQAQPAPAAAPVAQSAPASTPRGPVRGVAKPAVPMVKCGYEECGKDVPADAVNCPHCKNILQAACDNPQCGKLFSVFETVCPHCGQNYGDGN